MNVDCSHQYKYMKDFKAISKTYYGKIKSSLGFKNEYARFFKEQGDEYYTRIFNSKPLIIEDFMQFLQTKKDVSSVLEIGCSTGIFPIKFNNIFANMEYTGLDISQKSINYCKKHSNFEFICADFLELDLNKKFDLIFSLDVIDHVYDIDKFITKIVQTTKKYAYINSYRGYFPDLEKHKMEWKDSDGVFYNNISVRQIKETLFKIGLVKEEFEIYPQKRDFNDEKPEMILKITKTRN